MSDRDVLERAAEALRKQGEPSPDDLTRLRERLLPPGNVKPLARASSARRLRWVLPIAAAFVAGTALAATPGGFSGMIDMAERLLRFEWLAAEQRAERARPKERVRRAQSPARSSGPTSDAPSAAPESTDLPLAEPQRVDPPASTQPAQAEQATQAEPTVAQADEQRAPPTPVRPARRTTLARQSAARDPKLSTEVPARVSKPAPSLDLTLYRRAHELHFGARDHGAALSAWDSYLAQLPHGTFAVEARYNRALCLMHLARYQDARAALLPFAEARGTGGYRRAEARRLLEALDQRP